MQKVYSVKLVEKLFEDEVSKQAYLKACKWLAQNVYGNESYSNSISVQIQKQPSRKSYKTVTVKLKSGKEKEKKEEVEIFTFKVILYFSMDFESTQKIFCNNCKNTINTFMGEDAPCRSCRVTSLLKELQHQTENISKRLSEGFGGMNGN